eukprot:TRINITY_DN213_c0_g1_i2.p1 TRINITY_DN213_c0_g1~~TRINITY_DN213_c0_g1_i2.p1  ORF type:complete len:204 (+),score=55.51 TRINITY_DN213_c0_g1_i2:44-613(+)
MAAIEVLAGLQSSMAALSVRPSSRSDIFGSSSAGILRVNSTFSERVAGTPLVIHMVKKKWEKKELKPSSKPVWQNMHVKVGDTVQVIAGAERGKVSEITRIFRHSSKVVLKDINLKTKYVKPRAKGEQGQMLQVESPVHSSNVMLYSKEQKVASRIGHKVLENGRKVRYLIKTGEIVDSLQPQKPAAKS